MLFAGCQFESDPVQFTVPPASSNTNAIGAASEYPTPGSQWPSLSERDYTWPSSAIPSLLPLVTLIMRNGHHSRARANISYSIRSDDVDGVRSAIEVTPTSCCNERNCKRVAAISTNGDATCWLVLAIFVGDGKCGATGWNGLCPSRDRARYSYRDRFAVGWPECVWSHSAGNTGWRLRHAIDACYRYAAGSARINFGCRRGIRRNGNSA